MTSRTLTAHDRRLAEPFRAMIPDSRRHAFWRRVRRGFYMPLGLFEDKELRGLLVVSVNEWENGRELWLQLATEPWWATQNRQEILDLIETLARKLNASRVVFESKRRAWQELAESLGFSKTVLVRFAKEVPDAR